MSNTTLHTHIYSWFSTIIINKNGNFVNSNNIIDHLSVDMFAFACYLRYGHLEVVKFLVNDSGCDLNQKSNNGSTPLDTARL